MADGSIVAWLTSAAPPMWGAFVVVVTVVVKFYPLWKARWNDARKIELDHDADLRGDLFERIRNLEARVDGEPARLDAAIATERRRCDAEMAEMRRDFNERIGQLTRSIAQNSQSAAHFLGDPNDMGGPRE